MDFICKYCGKSCKNKNSLAQHEVRCKYNENRKPSYFATHTFEAWNKVLIISSSLFLSMLNNGEPVCI